MSTMLVTDLLQPSRGGSSCSMSLRKLSISPGRRSRTQPSNVEAQNLQPMRQPT